MRTILTTLFYLFVTALYSQTVDKVFVDNWIRLSDPTITLDSVRAYYIEGELFDAADSSTLNARLRKIPKKNLGGIWYSKMKKCNYVPGRGSIYIKTIKKKEIEDVVGWLSNAKKLFVDKYVSPSQHILTDSQDPVLVIDGQAIYPIHARDALNKINPKNIYDISVVGFFPVPATIYGQNSKNGLVQIWTKERL